MYKLLEVLVYIFNWIYKLLGKSVHVYVYVCYE